jgi:hypothetical protein
MRLSAFTRAIVGIQVDADGRLCRRTEIAVSDQEILQRLVAFFPGVGTSATSPTAGGWMPGVLIRLHRADGSEILIYVDPEMGYWSEMKGDWPLAPQFRRFIDWLQANPSTGVQGRYRTDRMDDDDA